MGDTIDDEIKQLIADALEADVLELITGSVAVVLALADLFQNDDEGADRFFEIAEGYAEAAEAIIKN